MAIGWKWWNHAVNHDTMGKPLAQETPMTTTQTTAPGIRVWDIPTRLFHWSLVALFAFSWWSAEQGEMDRHKLSGLTLLGLVAFRLLWGIIGSNTARFASFLRAPAQVIAYLKGQTGPTAGHNPLGGYSVLALLLLLTTQITSGLFAVDTDGLESGPLSYLVDFDQGRQASHLHSLSFNLLLGLIALHIAAVLFYRVIRKRNLLTPMLTGRDAELPVQTPALKPAPLWRLALAVVLAAALALWMSKGAPL